MATKWLGNNILELDLSYWIIRDNDEGSIDLTGKIKFDLWCKKLDDSQPQVSVGLITMAMKHKCGVLIRNVAIKQQITEMEILDMVAHAIHQQRVDIKSIEPDAERITRILDKENRNKQLFDKISEKV